MRLHRSHAVKPVFNSHSKKTKIGFQDQYSLNAGQKYCRMQHFAVLLTCIKLHVPHGFKTVVLTIFKWLLKTGFTVFDKYGQWVH